MSSKKIYPFEGNTIHGSKGEDDRAERAQLSKKMDEVKLLMFNKVYYTFLSNPVKINIKLHVSFGIMEL